MICPPCRVDEHDGCANVAELSAVWCDCQHLPHGTPQVLSPPGIESGEAVQGG